MTFNTSDIALVVIAVALVVAVLFGFNISDQTSSLSFVIANSSTTSNGPITTNRMNRKPRTFHI